MDDGQIVTPVCGTSCPYSADRPLRSTVVTPETHYAFAHALGAPTAVLLPFPRQADSCGRLLKVLREEDGDDASTAAPAATGSASTKRSRDGDPLPADSAVDTEEQPQRQPEQEEAVAEAEASATASVRDRFVFITPPEPLCPAVFELLCALLREYALRRQASSDPFGLWTQTSAVVHLRSVTDGDGVVQLCQLFRTASFLQWDDLLERCRVALDAWCDEASQHSTMHGLLLEGLVRKTAALLRDTQAAIDSTDPSVVEAPPLLAKLDAWRPSDQPKHDSGLLTRWDHHKRPTKRSQPERSPEDLKCRFMKWAVPVVLLPLADVKKRVEAVPGAPVGTAPTWN